MGRSAHIGIIDKNIDVVVKLKGGWEGKLLIVQVTDDKVMMLNKY